MGIPNDRVKVMPLKCDCGFVFEIDEEDIRTLPGYDWAQADENQQVSLYCPLCGTFGKVVVDSFDSGPLIQPSLTKSNFPPPRDWG